MSGGLPLSLVFVDLDILLSLLMIILAIAWFFIWNIVMNYCKYILILQKWLKTQFSKCIKNFQFDNALEYTQYVFQAILHSYGTIH